jgi:hypothetical protein
MAAQGTASIQGSQTLTSLMTQTVHTRTLSHARHYVTYEICVICRGIIPHKFRHPAPPPNIYGISLRGTRPARALKPSNNR